MITPLEELIQKINDDGFWISQLYQTDKDWVAALRPKGNWTTSYSVADTARNALIRAWKKAEKGDTNWSKVQAEQKEDRRIKLGIPERVRSTKRG
jgi:hypothetical protein